MMASMGDKLRCTRCLEELEYLVDPRKLTCNHVYCTICLEAVAVPAEGELRIECSLCG